MMKFMKNIKIEKKKITAICSGRIIENDAVSYVTINDQFAENDIESVLDLVESVIFERTIKSNNLPCFRGVTPDEIIITTDRVVKTPADIEYETLSRRLQGTASDYTRAILKDGKIVGWKEK